MRGLVAETAKKGSPMDTKSSPKSHKRGLLSAGGAQSEAGTAMGSTRSGKNIIEPVQTAGVPPKEGSTNLANMGSMRNSRAALTKMVVEKRTIMKAHLPDEPFPVESFPILSAPADIKLFSLPFFLALTNCDSSAQLYR